jgi:hypothetical protein
MAQQNTPGSNKIVGFFDQSKEILATVTSIATGVAFIYKLVQQVDDFDGFSLAIELLNIIVLIAGMCFVFNRKFNISLPQTDSTEFQQLVKLEVKQGSDISAEEKKLKTRLEGVSVLIRELLNNLKRFAICLIALYVFLFINDYNSEQNNRNLEGSITKSFPNQKSYTTEQVNDTATVIATAKDSAINAQKDSLLMHNFSLIELFGHSDLISKTTIHDVFSTLIDNLFNVASAVFLFIAFFILYSRPMDADNNRLSSGYWLTPLFIVILIMVLNCVIILNGAFKTNLQTLILTSRMLCGMFNGVGMALLVSRLISMEYFFKESSGIFKNFYLAGATIILPIYVIAQPLWGFLEMPDFHAMEALKAFILIICLWGKIFLVMIIYYMLSKGWIQAYLYMLPIGTDKIKVITKSFYEMENIIHEGEE